MKQTERYLEFLTHARNLSMNTINSIKNDLEQFGDSLENANRSDVEMFVIKQNKQGLKGSTVARRVSSYKQFFEWQIYNGLRNGINPAGLKIAPKVKENPYDTITRDELIMLYDNATNDNVKLAIALSGFAGLRIGEIVGIGNKNFIFEDDNGNLAIHLKETKGDNERFVTLGLLPCKNLVESAHERGGLIGKRGALTENGLSRLMRTYFNSMGFKSLSAHGLRSTFSTISVKNNVRVDVVRDVLGHTTLDGNAITSKYVAKNTVEQQYEELNERWA